MTKHKTGTREEWLTARRELLKAEKELTRRSDELARRRQELPWVRIAKDYRFKTDEGGAALAHLFRGRSQLLLYRFMFGPDYTAGCPNYSAIADGFNGCAAPTMILVVLGMMNPFVIIGVAIIISAEKVLPRPAIVVRLVGIVAIIAGVMATLHKLEIG